MENSPVDRRIARTETRLHHALLDLMGKKSIDQISVTELCKKADVNRNTFYAHYNNTTELLNHIEDEMLKHLSNSIDIMFFAGDTHKAITKALTEVKNNRNICTALLDTSTSATFFQKIASVTHDRTLDSWKAAGFRGNDDDLEQLFCFVVNGCLCVILSWLKGGLVKTPEQVATFVEKIALDGLRSFMPELHYQENMK